MVRITLPDGDAKEYSPDVTPIDIARDISEGLARKSIGAVFNGDLIALDRALTTDGDLRLLTDRDPEALDILRHSAAHILAQAVKRHRPEAQLGFGPAIEDGFYYDFLVDKPFTPEDLEIFQKEMKKITKEKAEFSCEILSREATKARLKEMGEELKVPHVDELEGDTVSIYTHDSFSDLCKGPHIPHTGKLKYFKLLTTSGAYWKGDENNPMLQRIYGTAFFTKEDLKAHLEMLEEAKQRDHRVLGKQLDLFTFTEEAGAGLVIFKPKGAMSINLLKKFIEGELVRRGYELTITPHLFRKELFETSGHLSHYSQNMFMAHHASEDQGYVVKPMNCPGHILVYKSDLRSYRDLPMRLFEFGTCYRFERSGVLHGLTRVRNLTIDDAHHFCTPDQLEGEIIGLMDFADFLYKTFGFEYMPKLATRPDDSIGTAENWEAATAALKGALEKVGWDYEMDEGGGAFYGPKIDIFVRDAIGRTWQLSTIQVDFNLPDRFELTYIDENGEKVAPRVVHRAIVGSIERFFGVLIEHTKGAFPVWLAPMQVRVLPISDKTNDYAIDVASKLKAKGFRAESDLRNEKIGYKIREGRLEKIPYLLVVGPKEAEDGLVAVNEREIGDTGAVKLEEFIDRLESEGHIPTSADR